MKISRRSREDVSGRAFFLFLALFALTLKGVGPDEAIETRDRFTVNTRSGDVLYTVTHINSVSQAETKEAFLIRDRFKNSYVFSNHSDFFRQMTKYEIRDLKRKNLMTVTLKFPFKSKTLDGTIKEARAKPELAEVPVPMTVEVVGLSKTVTDRALEDADMLREMRSDFREVIDPMLLEAIETMRDDLFPLLPFATYCSHLSPFILHGQPCGDNARVEVKAVEPDCSFDAGFGYACNEKQKQIANQAKEKQKSTETY